jgi:hypothetical protein
MFLYFEIREFHHENYKYIELVISVACFKNTMFDMWGKEL